MKQALLAALLLGAAALPARAGAQPAAAITQSIAGTRLDLSATGDVTRVPDLAIITAGVTTRAATASGALQQAATRMQRVRAALKSAGIEDRDLQTSNINLNPEYTYENNQPPKLNGYSASNQVTVRFRDIANAGRILDALVAEGANTINGPNLTIDRPETALDEARAKAIVRQYDDKDFSLTDASSFAIMERTGIQHAFTFDRHFAQYAFTVLT